MAQKATVTISGGFYTVITVQIDVFESRIIDERHFATEEEAKEHQRKTIFNSKNNIYCFVSYIAQGVRCMWVLSLFYCTYKIVEESFGTKGTLIFWIVLYAILAMLGAQKGGKLNTGYIEKGVTFRGCVFFSVSRWKENIITKIL